MTLSMTEFSALQEKLLRLAVTPGFLLDDRTVQQKLTFLKNYTSRIPFETDNIENKSWDSLLFPADWSVDRLTEIYQRPELAEGQLPPLQAFVLTFLRLLETPAALMNWFPAAHREFYYRQQLGLTERKAEPARVALGMQLTTDTPELLVPAGLRFSAGQDTQGTPIVYQLDNDVLACQVHLSEMLWSNATGQKRTACGADTSPELPVDDVILVAVPDGEQLTKKEQIRQLSLGFNGIKPGQTLSVFWQLKSPGAFNIQWQYQDITGTWQELKTLSRDDTQGFLGSGLWQATLPDDSFVDDKNRCWLRGIFPGGAAVYPQVTALLVNAMTATLCDVDKLDSGVLAQPLAEGKISQPVSRLAGLSGVLQPFPSFGGRAGELTDEFYIRTAQRLAHRNRALSWKDMALLLKTQFSSIFDVITPSVKTMTKIPAPETQTLVVLPRADACDNDDALRPSFSAYRLMEMQQWLRRHSSGWQNILVANPDYQPVNVAFDVTWQTGVNPDYARSQLQKRLAYHYMPWSQEKGRDVVTGSRLDYYDVIARIQDDPNVRQVDSLALNGDILSVPCADNQVLVLDFHVGAL